MVPVFPFLNRLFTRPAQCSRVLLLTSALLLSACGGGGSDGTGSGFSISGTGIVPAFSVADSDTNDVNRAVVSNGLTSPQPVPNPSNIGGYVNVAGTGAPGQSFATGDTDDYFKVSLKRGQQVVLTISEFDNNDVDLDLYLYRGDGTQIIDSSLGVAKYETLTIAEDGEYLVNVFAVRGASNYLVSIGLDTSASTAQVASSYRLSADFVPGQVVAKRDASTIALQGGLRAMSAGSVTDFVPLSSQGDGVSLYRLQEGSGSTVSLAGSGATAADPAQKAVLKKIMQGTSEEQQEKLRTLYAAKALARVPGIVFAEPNYLKQPLLTPNDEFYSLQWHYPLINLPAAWDVTTGSRNVIVAVIDSGVALSHVDLQGQLIGGYDFISDAASARDGDGIDSNPNDEGDLGAGPGASSFHGTHVAGTVAAASNNQIGVAGVAWNSSIMPIRVIGVGGGADYDIAQGVLYAAGLPNASGTVPPKRADIINLSLGGPQQGQQLTEALIAARNAGVIIIAAAGNDGSSQLMYPASTQGVVSVSAVDANRQLAPYSSYGTAVDVAAPGGNLDQDVGGDGRPDGVLSTLVDDAGNSLLGYYNGTSMAAPHVAGVAALMKSVYSGLTPAGFDSLLRSGEITRDLGSAGRDNLYGYGLIDARKAVEAAQRLGGGSVTLPPPLLSASPSALNFGRTSTQVTLFLENAGADDLKVLAISESASWLNISTANTDAGSGLGSYRVTVNRSGLEPGVYQTDITVRSSVNTVVIPVIMEVSTLSASGDLGLIYFVLFDADTFKPLTQVKVNVDNGRYDFSFSDLPAGRYTLLMGSDMDNDDFICDEGEACGMYPTLARPEDIDLTGNLRGLEFTGSFLSAIPSSQSNSVFESTSQNGEKSLFNNGKGFKLLPKNDR